MLYVYIVFGLHVLAVASTLYRAARFLIRTRCVRLSDIKRIKALTATKLLVRVAELAKELLL